MTLHCRDEGAGEAVVLLHAFPLHSGMWDDQVAALRARYRVITPDLPGFGKSDGPDDPTACSIDGFADGVADLLDELGIDRAVVGGLSMGGYTTFSFLRRHRHRVNALILADTRAAADSPEVAARRVAQQEQIAAEGAGPVIDAMVTTLLSEGTRTNRPDIVERARSLMSDNSPAALVGALDAMRHRADATDLLAGIDVPTLVVVGAEDAPSPPTVAAEMAETIPDGRLVQLRGAGHLSNLEEPEFFNRALTRFLDWQRAS